MTVARTTVATGEFTPCMCDLCVVFSAFPIVSSLPFRFPVCVRVCVLDDDGDGVVIAAVVDV